MAKKTTKVGRPNKFKKKLGETKIICVTIPISKEVEIRKGIADVLKPYLDSL